MDFLNSLMVWIMMNLDNISISDGIDILIHLLEILKVIIQNMI